VIREEKVQTKSEEAPKKAENKDEEAKKSEDTPKKAENGSKFHIYFVKYLFLK